MSTANQMGLMKRILLSALSLFQRDLSGHLSFQKSNKCELNNCDMLDSLNDVCSPSCETKSLSRSNDGAWTMVKEAKSFIMGKKWVDDESAPLQVIPEWEALSLENRTKLSKILRWENLSRWDFDIWELNDLCEGRPLLFLGWTLLASPYAELAMAHSIGENDLSLSSVPGYHFVDNFNMKVEKLVGLIRSIEADYQNVPYHNRVHAADVFQTTHSLLQMGSKDFVDDIQIFSVLLAAAGHDVHHPGRNNMYQINAKTEYATLYKNESCLENMHAASMIDRFSGEMLMPASDVSSGLLPEQSQDVQRLLKSTILGTDMAKHFDIVNEVDAIVGSPAYDLKLTTELSTEDKEKFLVFLLHVADISNPAKPAPFFIDWATLVLDEFFEQGDEEKSLNLTLSPLCDRDVTSREGAQIGFIEHIIYPTFETLGAFCEEIKTDVLPLIRQNLEYWKAEMGKVG